MMRRAVLYCLSRIAVTLGLLLLIPLVFLAFLLLNYDTMVIEDEIEKLKYASSSSVESMIRSLNDHPLFSNRYPPRLMARYNAASPNEPMKINTAIVLVSIEAHRSDQIDLLIDFLLDLPLDWFVSGNPQRDQEEVMSTSN